MSKTQEPGRTLHIRFSTRQVRSFKVIRSSDNTEVRKRKTQSTFSKNNVLQSRQSTASLRSFFRKL